MSLKQPTPTSLPQFIYLSFNLTMKDKLQPTSTRSVLTMYQVLYNPNILTLQCPYRNQSNNSTIKNTIMINFYLFKETFLLNHIRISVINIDLISWS